MTSPMQRTKKVLKEQGITHQKVEYWNGFVKPHGIRVDLFNIIDIIALTGEITGIQVCGSDFSSHKKKIMEEYVENTLEWLKSGGKLEVWGWRKRKKVKGKKAIFWSPRIADIYIFHGELIWEERKGEKK